MHSANNDPENNPGYAFNKKVFDVFNVHFHGLETVPHMFNPLGTLEPTAPWISIFPEYMMMKNETRYDTNNQCFCYHLPISKTMSTGTFLYHVHRQGSQAMQIWSGMIGLIQVGNRNYKNSFDYILPNKFNVQKDYALSIWAPSLRFNGTAELFSKNFKKNDDGSVNPNSKTAEMQLNSWLHSVSISIEPILINNDYQPTIIINKNEIVRFRVVCLMVSIFCAFAIVPDIKNIDPTLADNQIEFYIIANDGIGIQNPIKQKRLVLSSAQRADILIKLEKPMQYQMRMDNVYELTAPMPGTNTLLGYIQVKNNKKKSNIKYKTSNYPINKWILPISIRPSIRKEEIIATKTFIFNTFASKRGIMPTGIASINHSLFKFNRIDYEIVGGTAVEFVLIAPEGVHSYVFLLLLIIFFLNGF